MPPFVVAYAGAAITMLALDALWLTTMVPRLYQPQLGSLLAERPNLAVAGVFYLLYLVGVLVFAILPALEARSWLAALGFGALLGLVAYGTYDFTNLSTLRNWPLSLSLIDVAWGTALTAVTALGGYWAVRWLLPG
ncbi:hypothetical protein ASC89_24875 [Devosia sp. Root413D1]|uniref:DUF2177 family protein n=1 Tax=unclassified Devosia TaxID=196773 RepID=UPI0006FD06EA|nr:MULTISPECIES: DUF2177 family protein [unclassified Devosia]KQU93376.1 hypothetical protein ASC68_22730 [Devosia sp. Root105]KQW74846.1 hypothetical protein ASC89_24875 [Devosia sp. Root413D1]